MSSHVIATLNTVSFLDKLYPAAIGTGGISANKQEGDKTTPIGVFPLRRLFYRPDRMEMPISDLPSAKISKDDGWCDDLSCGAYNTLVKLPHQGSYENLFRDDEIYDIFIEVGYNDSPPVLGRGSAVFVHLARAGFSSTEGCIALMRQDLLELAAVITKETLIEIRDEHAPEGVYT